MSENVINELNINLKIELSSSGKTSTYISDFRHRKKNPSKTAFGAVLEERVIQEVIDELGFTSDIVHGYRQPVDYLYKELGFGFECKRLECEYVTKSWLQKEVVERFREMEKEIGKSIPHRGLVITEKKWGKELDFWLKNKGIKVCIVGKIDSEEEIAKAKEVFKAWFIEMLWKICDGKI